MGSMVIPKHVQKLYIVLYKEKIKLVHIKIHRSINLYFVLIQILFRILCFSRQFCDNFHIIYIY